MTDDSQIIDDPCTTYFNRNAVKKAPMNYNFQMTYRDSFLKDGSKPNKSVIKMTRGKPGYKNVNHTSTWSSGLGLRNKKKYIIILFILSPKY